jgi:hypothetical protein
MNFIQIYFGHKRNLLTLSKDLFQTIYVDRLRAFSVDPNESKAVEKDDEGIFILNSLSGGLKR